MPAAELQPFEIVIALLNVADRHEIGRQRRQRRIALLDGGRCEVEPLLQEFAIALKRFLGPFARDDVDKKEPRLAERLPFLPKQRGVDRGGGGAGDLEPRRTQKNRPQILRDADAECVRSAGAGEIERIGDADLRIGQQVSLDDLGCRDAELLPRGAKIRIVAQHQAVKVGEGDRPAAAPDEIRGARGEVRRPVKRFWPVGCAARQRRADANEGRRQNTL